MSRLSESEIRKLERSTPFIKEGVLKSAQQDFELKDVEWLSKIQLTDLVFEDEKELGKGSYGFVYLARHRTHTNKLFAVKKLLKQHFKKAKMAKALEREI